MTTTNKKKCEDPLYAGDANAMQMIAMNYK